MYRFYLLCYWYVRKMKDLIILRIKFVEFEINFFKVNNSKCVIDNRKNLDVG